jgi:glycosyltransferase involved in cell wall biosynthesis
MRILLDCRPLQVAGPAAERSRLIFSAAGALSREGVEWVLAADHRYRPGLFPELSGQIVIRRALPGGVGWKCWYDRQIPRISARMGVDLIWLTGGISSRTIDLPVVLWMPERVDPAQDGGIGINKSLYRARVKQGIERASAVVCYSDRDRAWLGRYLPEAIQRIQVMPVLPDESIGPLSTEEKEEIRSGISSGKEYFLADLSGCGEGTAVELLKAFSIFKKRQQSGMRLVLTGMPGIVRVLKTYKYRHDVDCAVEAEQERLSLAGAAYAVIIPAEGNSLGSTLLNTWRAGVPAIVPDGGWLEEMAQGAALGIVQDQPASLAGQLMRIYKEEDLRKELIGKGFERLKVYSRENFRRVLRVITEIAAC